MAFGPPRAVWTHAPRHKTSKRSKIAGSPLSAFCFSGEKLRLNNAAPPQSACVADRDQQGRPKKQVLGWAVTIADANRVQDITIARLKALVRHGNSRTRKFRNTIGEPSD